ncbi:SAGA-associated factor 29 [Camelus dromedarius]|uniref:SAGA-associated factor 29 n=1 Tax=Camelus dromedarius TaxID=9838 RepID=A0A5N4CEG3_CAMDR|nr:SAGA-associated factor 29 [Camelus dromedarius]
MPYPAPCIGKPGDKLPPLCGAIPASGDYVAKPGDKVAALVKAVGQEEQWTLAEVASDSHATKYEDDYPVLFEDTSYTDGHSPPLSVAQLDVAACKEPKKK